MKMKFFDLARRVSKNSNHHQHKIGVAIVNKNSVISLGFNKLQTHPRSKHPYKSLHAEVHSLIGLAYNELKGCHAYVYRERKDGTPALSKPCPSCHMALKEAGIKKIYYSTNGGFSEADV